MTSDVMLTIPTPDDWHVHLRDDSMLAHVTPYTADVFRYALVMPNLVPPITSTMQAIAYQRRIIAAAGSDANPGFRPLMTLYLNNDVSTDDLLAGHGDGIIHAAKYYPAGATTNSDAGGSSLDAMMPTLELMSETGVPLLVHAESTDESVDIFDRERHFLDAQLAPVCARLPELRVTVEHLSTVDGLEFVREHDQVAGSITPHHLSCDRSDLLANGLRPDLYCKPVLNSASDREALVSAATSGDDCFFLGTDSAPHPQSNKLTAFAKPGIFNAPYAIPVVVDVFAAVGQLDQLEQFVSLNGAKHYGLPPAGTTVTIEHNADWTPAPITTPGGSAAGVQIFGSAAAGHWTVRRNEENP